MKFKFIISFFACLLLFGTELSAQTKRAIVIGIGDYPKESGWRRINGHNDIEIITTTLNQYGFNNRNIQILNDQQATKKAIISAFENLIKNSAKGDIAYIHFSGHGQLITDLIGNQSNGFSEAWIPYDAQKRFVKGKYEGENHLIDNEINALLHRLRNAVGTNGDILVVVDACHSGGSTRGEDENDDEVIARGTIDRFVIPLATKPKPKAENTTSWTTISASQSFQTNFESRIDGKWFGSLSYAIFYNKDKFNGNSYFSIFEILKDKVNNLVRFPQTPVIENESRTNLIFVNR